MEAFRWHVYVCTQQKPGEIPSCTRRGSEVVLEKLREEVNKRGLMNEVHITTCGSLGLCEHGPNMVVYPEGVWYSGVQPEEVPEIVEQHFQNGTVVERLAWQDAGELRKTILDTIAKMRAAMGLLTPTAAKPR